MSHEQEASSSSSSSNQQPLRWQYSEFDDGNFQIRGRTLFFLIVLLSVILLVVLLFLYARWVCRFPPPPPPPRAAALRPPPPPRRGLDAAAISGLPIVLHSRVELERGSSTECCICLGVFDDGDKVKVLPQCRHCFHSECVDTWLAARPSCPLCRASVRVDPPV